MLLVIDVGNTNIVFGVYEGDELVDNWRLSSIKERTSDEYGMLFKQILNCSSICSDSITDVIISSVVPPLMYTLPSTMIKYFGIEPLVVDSSINTGIKICYDNPKEVGADRIVNAVAVKEYYGGPAIIIDIGTAVTFCVLDGDSNYQGGVIVPGISISADALFNRTAKLPKIEIIKPPTIVGKNTINSMQSGLVNGYVGMIDSLIESIAAEMNFAPEEYKIITTGGFSGLITESSKFQHIVDRNLTLKGLNKLFQMKGNN
ncbi:MAG: type III pantothenate kinase [Tissierellia bacterium]|nr:type III pantothenate kinase [Tissierellia bacterium]